MLADDALEGRDTGSAGHRRAGEYVAREFEKLGLEPAGTDGYIQPVTLRSRTIDEAHTASSWSGRRAPSRSSSGRMRRSLRVDPAPEVDAGLVFAGYGLSIPEAGHDDFRDLDARARSS